MASNPKPEWAQIVETAKTLDASESKVNDFLKQVKEFVASSINAAKEDFHLIHSRQVEAATSSASTSANGSSASTSANASVTLTSNTAYPIVSVEQGSSEAGSEGGAGSKRKKRGETYLDLADRTKVKGLSTWPLKIALLKRLDKLAQEADNKVNEASRKFLVDSVKPILRCLEGHHNGSMERFSQKWDGKSHVKFGKKCCRGNGTTCTL